MICARCIVSGRVQGVWFRESTRTRAQHLGLSGRVINLPDGTVEVIVCGEDDAVARLQAWLWSGPPMSRVEGVVCEPLPGYTPRPGFRTG